ncbi:hypothetical protein MRX96_056085 [Rhipicephalus microplus]
MWLRCSTLEKTYFDLFFFTCFYVVFFPGKTDPKGLCVGAGPSPISASASGVAVDSKRDWTWRRPNPGTWPRKKQILRFLRATFRFQLRCSGRGEQCGTARAEDGGSRTQRMRMNAGGDVV